MQLFHAKVTVSHSPCQCEVFSVCSARVVRSLCVLFVFWGFACVPTKIVLLTFLIWLNKSCNFFFHGSGAGSLKRTSKSLSVHTRLREQRAMIETRICSTYESLGLAAQMVAGKVTMLKSCSSGAISLMGTVFRTGIPSGNT